MRLPIAAGLALALLSLLPARLASAQAGNPPVFHDGRAGPYSVRVRIDPPDVIPGMARIEIEAPDADVESIRLLALPIDTRQKAYPPTPDVAERSPRERSRFEGQLWLMSSGSWEVRLLVDGARGPGELAVPVAALPTHVAAMPASLGAALLGLLILLALGIVSIVSAAVKEGQLPPGEQPGPSQRRRARIATAVAGAIVLALIAFGDRWWAASARAYARSIYRPLTLSAEVADGGQLELTLDDPGWLPSRRLDDLVATNGHAMDLWVVALSDLERVWHLHPEQLGPGRFAQALPAMGKGRYQLFASVVHADGLEENAQREIDLPVTPGRALGPDDASGQGGPVGSAEALVAGLPNGGRLTLLARDPLRSGTPEWLRFRVDDRFGQPEQGLQAIGSLAEATVVSADLASFARVSTRGTVAPASWAAANAGAAEPAEEPSSELAFPYEFPRPGRYRMFIQIRRAGQNEIGLLDVRVL